MKIQAMKINTWGKNVYVKVPVNSKGKFMGRIIKELNDQNIKLNITAVYNAKQTEKILKLINKKTKVIISILLRVLDWLQEEREMQEKIQKFVPEFVSCRSIKLAKKFKNVENTMGKC